MCGGLGGLGWSGRVGGRQQRRIAKGRERQNGVEACGERRHEGGKLAHLAGGGRAEQVEGVAGGGGAASEGEGWPVGWG